MGLPGIKGQYGFALSEQTINAPEDWSSIRILGTFENEAVQANIETEKFTFVREEFQKIINHLDGGLNGGIGIYEGPRFDITAFNKINEYLAFKGYLDLSDDMIIDEVRNRVSAKIVKSNGMNQLNDKLSSLTYGYLEDPNNQRRAFSDSDYITLNYVVEDKDNAFEILVSSIVLYLMVKELAQGIKEIAEQVATTVGITTGGGTTGGFGALVYNIVLGLALSAYTTLMLSTVIDLTKDLFDTLVPPVRKAKVMTLRTALSKVASYLGYSFESNIDDLDNVYYLPSNLNVDEFGIDGFLKTTQGPDKGIPNSSDYGYVCSDMFDLVKRLFDGKYAIIDNKLAFYNKYDDFWVRTSTFQMRDRLTPPNGRNASELSANFVMSFQTDNADIWTIDNFKGTNIQVVTDSVNSQNQEAKTLKGLEQIDFPVALGNRKDELNALERFLKEVFGAADDLINFFGGNSNYADRVNSKIGVLKVSNNNYTIAKLLRLSGGKLPSNHRDLLSAKYLYNKYHYGRSFVRDNYHGQKYTYNDVEIAFGFEDFLKVIKNSYFRDQNGAVGKIVKISWALDKDKAVVDYWIRKPYTKNLKETTIEP